MQERKQDFPEVSEWYRVDGSRYDDNVTNIWLNETVGLKLRTRKVQGPFQHKTAKFVVEFQFLGNTPEYFHIEDAHNGGAAVTTAYEFAKENNKEDNT